MATKPYFLWGDSTRAAPDSDVAAVFAGASSGATETALAGDAALAASPELGPAAVARPRLRRSSAAGSGKQQNQQQQGGSGGGGARKPPQRGLGVAELERLRCGGDPLRELSAVVLGDAVGGVGAQGHPLLHYHHPHHHLQVPGSAFEPAPGAGGARYCSQLLAPAPPPPAAAAGPVCFLHPHAGCQRAAPVAPEQQYFRDRWTRMGSFSVPAGGGAAADHQSQLLIPAPEHPSSQSTIWRPAASSPSSCLHASHRCDICSRRMRAMAERGALAPAATPPASPKADAAANTVSDYSIYDLATAMATARQGGDAFLARERKRGAADGEAPAKKEVREIEFFPAASAHQTGAGGRRAPVPDESEFAAPFYSSPYYGAAASHTGPPQLDLSLRL